MSTPFSISAAEYHRMQADSMTEEQLQAAIVGAAQRAGWLVYHTHDSRRSAPGFPDLVLVHDRQRRVLYRELKTQTGRLRPAQQEWLNALSTAGHDAGVWRPIDWFEQRISHDLHPEAQIGGYIDAFATDLTRYAEAAGLTLLPWQIDVLRKILALSPATVRPEPRS